MEARERGGFGWGWGEVAGSKHRQLNEQKYNNFLKKKNKKIHRKILISKNVIMKEYSN